MSDKKVLILLSIAYNIGYVDGVNLKKPDQSFFNNLFQKVNRK